jgi:metallo-beta-lactamase class B
MRMTVPALAFAAAALAALPMAAASGQKSPPAPATFPTQTQFPKANVAALARHLSAARRLAEPDLMPEFNWRCLTSPLDRPMVFAIQHDGLVPATRVFDQLYSVGQNAVSAWALDTSDGIILIDALNSPDEAREIIVPNLVKLGLDPARIRYVLVTHGHGDHWGGAKYLQDTYGARVVMSAIDWDMVEKPGHGGGPFADLVPPRRDIAVKDGDTITLGKTTVRLHVTPGHTPGALSMIFPATDKGKPHMVGLMGGSGGGQDSATVHQQIASLARWEQLTARAGVDALIANHPSHQAGNERQALLRLALPGDANPYVYGKSRARRFAAMLGQCSRVQLARMGETGD